MRLFPVASVLTLVAACGGSSHPGATGTAPLPADSPSGAQPASPATTGGPTPPASLAPRPTVTPSRTAAASSTARTAAPGPARTTTPSGQPSPRPQASPSPSPRPSPTKAPSPAPPPGPTRALEMTAGYRFSPMDLTIGVGDAVRAHNGDTMDHTFTGPTWDSGNVAPGAYARVFRFNKAGTFRFVCTPHEGLGMTGTLTVR